MAKIPRVYQKLFALNALSTYVGQFGSKAAGTPITTLDGNTIQALAAFTGNGWPDAVNASNKAPFLEEMNALHRLLFQQIANIFQDGVPVWDPSTPYYTGCIVRKDTTSELYSSSIDNNINNALPSQANNGSWTYINTINPVPSGTVVDFAGSSPPAGWILCDGTSYPTSSYPALFAAIGYAWGGSGPNFNVPDLRGRATIGAGTGSGLTARTLAQLIGEESHILSITEIPAHAHIQNAHHHGPPVGATEYISVSALPGPYGVVAGGYGIFSNATQDATATEQNAGGGGSHNNIQPSAVVTKIIKI